MNKIFPLIFIVVFLTGCAKLTHLPQLLTLDALSKNKEKTNQFVQAENERFENLVAAFKNGELSLNMDKDHILNTYGKPIFKKHIQRGGQDFDRWLYRYTAKIAGSEKIYLYFDAQGRLVSWEHKKGKADGQTT